MKPHFITLVILQDSTKYELARTNHPMARTLKSIKRTIELRNMKRELSEYYVSIQIMRDKLRQEEAKLTPLKSSIDYAQSRIANLEWRIKELERK